MIYIAKCDDELLFNPYLEDYALSDSRLEMIDNDIGGFSFSFYPEHPLYNRITPKKSRIKIYRDGNLIWLGRVTNPLDVLDEEKTYNSEHCLAYLNDSIMRPFEFTGSPSDFFTLVIQQHNNQVSEDQQFVIGECTVTDPNDTIVRSSIYHLKTFDVVRERMLKMLGGHIVITYNEQEKPVISWLSDIDLYSTQTIRFGENLVDFERNLLYDSFCTAVIPLGYNENNDLRLTIASVNDGKDYLVNQSLADVYGIIYANLQETTWDDVTVPSILYTKGLNYLNSKGVTYKSRIDLKAEDISFMDADIGQFVFLTKVVFELKTQANVSYLITDFSVDLRDPTDVTVVLSDETFDYVSVNLTSVNARNEAENAERIRNIEANYTTNEQAQAISQQVIENTTIIQQQAESIISEALERYTLSNDFTTFQSEVYSRLTQLADRLEIAFNTASTETSNLASDTTARFNEIISFIRLLPTTQTTEGGIVIGENTSNIMMKLENDVLYFFSGDEYSVTRDNAIAYFETGKLFVNEVQVQKISIGTVGQMMYFSVIGSGDNRCLFLNGRLSS